MTDDRILKRSEVKKENTWATEDMFPSDQAWSEEYEALKALPARAAALKGTLGRSAGDTVSADDVKALADAMDALTRRARGLVDGPEKAPRRKTATRGDIA